MKMAERVHDKYQHFSAVVPHSRRKPGMRSWLLPTAILCYASIQLPKLRVGTICGVVTTPVTLATYNCRLVCALRRVASVSSGWTNSPTPSPIHLAALLLSADQGSAPSSYAYYVICHFAHSARTAVELDSGCLQYSIRTLLLKICSAYYKLCACYSVFSLL